jgi:steroid 5-alpha reductase family enzyme
MSSIATAWFSALPVLLAAAVAVWGFATIRRNVGLVDIFWSLFFLLAAALYAMRRALDARALLILAITALWALRLAIHLAARNLRAAEDHRYRAMRRRHEPGFAWKSLYLVFGLQALLAWLISAPLAAAILAPHALDAWDVTGSALALFGIVFEAIADAQLRRFKADPVNAAAVMDRGLWRYSRHPNYFGECCVWWGLYLLAAAAGGWWTLFSPLLMTWLLLKVSGVVLLEQDIAQRRPGYRAYISRTNAFIPGPRRSG